MREDSFKTVVYSFVVADLFHYGHLQLLMTAKSLGEYHICGVLTDEAAAAYRPRPISNLDERIGVISSVKYVDRVIPKQTDGKLSSPLSSGPRCGIVAIILPTTSRPSSSGNDGPTIPHIPHISVSHY